MKKNILLTAFLLTGLFLGVSAQEYYIEGFYERHGEGKYTLKDVHTNGIYLNGKTSLSGTLPGTKKTIKCDNLDATMVKFTFNMATTDCPTKWDKGFYFEYWDDDKNKWVNDVEACRNSDADYSQKDVVIMLVLDYSSSMKNNISELQSTAVKFINDVSKVSRGNIHVGIIAFSGMDLARNQYFPITPISRENSYDFERFIRTSQKGKETALYYSMDNALKMIDNYVSKKGMSQKEFNGAYMITFTDGLDNASINDKISVTMHRGRRNEYLSYLSGKLSGSSRKTVLGQPVENFAIGYTGSEEFTSEDIAFFRDVLQQTTPDEDHFKLASQFEEVEAFFEYILSNLIKRWENLNMYIGEAQYGKVRWVLNCGEISRPTPPIDKPVRMTRSPWFGVSAEIGAFPGLIAESGVSEGLIAGANIDVAFSLNKTIAVGGRAGFFYSDGFGFLLGPEVKITFPKNNAVIAGIGGGMMAHSGAFYVRAGYKMKKPLFFTAEALFGGNGVGVGVGVGYSFGGKLRER